MQADMVLSSANNVHENDEAFSLSLMKIINKMCPRTEPRGTPWVMLSMVDCTPFTVIYGLRFYRYEGNQSEAIPRIPKYLSLDDMIGWSTKSMALRKSRKREYYVIWIDVII